MVLLACSVNSSAVNSSNRTHFRGPNRKRSQSSPPSASAKSLGQRRSRGNAYTGETNSRGNCPWESWKVSLVTCGCSPSLNLSSFCSVSGNAASHTDIVICGSVPRPIQGHRHRQGGHQELRPLHLLPIQSPHERRAIWLPKSPQ